MTLNNTTKFFSPSDFAEIVAWATTPYASGITDVVKRTKTETISQIRTQANNTEKKWGNEMIGQKSNGNWTTLLGERLVHDLLVDLGQNPRKPKRKNGYEPDWETDGCIYEIKTRNWTTSGTAGEKVPAVMYKYSDIPELYGKPLKIVCVAYQEWELTNGNTKVFGDVSPRQQQFLDLAAGMGITYVKFSELINA